MALLYDVDILLLALCIVLVYLVVTRHLNNSSLAHIPGPPSPSRVFGEQDIWELYMSSNASLGHTVDLQHQPVAGELEQGWLRTYGNACKISGPFSVSTFAS